MVSKFEVAQSKECIVRLDKYVRMLDALINLCELLRPQAGYRYFPDDFEVSQKKTIDTILADFKSMKYDAQEVALDKAESVNVKTEGKD